MMTMVLSSSKAEDHDCARDIPFSTHPPPRHLALNRRNRFRYLLHLQRDTCRSLVNINRDGETSVPGRTYSCRIIVVDGSFICLLVTIP